MVTAANETATLIFQGCTIDPLNGYQNGERTFSLPGLPKALILDQHFQGLTPLNEISRELHLHDCIVISGLASHPFGSWQPHGNEKTFMWIRDELPHCLPSIRFILYGYDTTLRPSNSFQTIADLANSFIDVLRAYGWASPTAKPLLFLAHSLGGVVLKKTLLMLAGSGEREKAIANLVGGVIFFGVPSRGMPLNDIFVMLGDQPNMESLVKDISMDSEYLQQLEKQFIGASLVRDIKQFWAYETKTSRMITHVSGGKYSRSGPDTVLVTPESATSGRCFNNRSATIQVDENHSDMVKFTRGEHKVHVVASRLAEICGIVESKNPSPLERNQNFSSGNGDILKNKDNLDTGWIVLPPNASDESVWWDDKFVINSLRAPERDLRIEQIERQHDYSFDWVYDNSSLGFSQWLRNGQGIYWISGKPGSGKSTAMKFIHNDARTSELLHQWKTGAHQITASFFFHYRGSSIQKSFEGLLRSIISQIFEAEPSLITIVKSDFCDLYRKRVEDKQYDFGVLQADVNWLIKYCKITQYSGLESRKILCMELYRYEKIFGLGVRQLLKDAGLKVVRTAVEHVNENGVKGKKTKHIFRPDVEELVKAVLKRNSSRNALQESIEDEEWTREKLEEVLRRLCAQTLFDLDLFLLLDALDEYDGRPEFISGFLKDLTQGVDFPRTKIRILFSSRPWNIFREEFHVCPGLRIHEHTENDIQNYCIGSIAAAAPQSAKYLLPLVETIVSRSIGVFLWVKLVLGDLFRVVVTYNQQTERVDEHLRQTLDSLPDQLDDYYAVIIERIPQGLRWATYVVLESLARSGNRLSVEDLRNLIWCSTLKKYPDNDRQMLRHIKQGQEFIQQVTGGLADIEPRYKVVQLMHQTIKEFVEAPQFREIVLGHNRAQLTPENGHSFLTKHHFLRGTSKGGNDTQNSQILFHHAREAESSTCISQYEFFSSSTRHRFDDLEPFRVSSPLTLAINAGLHLLLEGLYQDDKLVVANSPDPLLCILERGRYHGLLNEDCLKIAKSLLVKGFVPEKDIAGITFIMRKIWTTDEGERRYPLDEDFLSLALLLFDHIKSHDSVRINLDSHWGSILHFSPPILAEKLLSSGANANIPDFQGQSPLDYLIANGSLHFSNPQYLYESAILLANNGGKLRKTLREEWDAFMQCLRSTEEIDTSEFARLGLPSWVQTYNY